MSTYTVRCLAEVEADTPEEALDLVRMQCIEAGIVDLIYFPHTIKEQPKTGGSES